MKKVILLVSVLVFVCSAELVRVPVRKIVLDGATFNGSHWVQK